MQIETKWETNCNRFLSNHVVDEELERCDKSLFRCYRAEVGRSVFGRLEMLSA